MLGAGTKPLRSRLEGLPVRGKTGAQWAELGNEHRIAWWESIFDDFSITPTLLEKLFQCPTAPQAPAVALL